MSIQDANPERRNLTLLSLSIIVFYLADGKFEDGNVRIQMINVHFLNPQILVYFVWGILIWFVFRYWLINRQDWKESYLSELTSLSDRFTKKYIKNQFIKSGQYQELKQGDREVLNLALHGKEIKLFYKHRATGNTSNDMYLEIDDWNKKAFIVFQTVKLFFIKPTLSTYFVPYFLFIFACFFGLVDLIKSILPSVS